MRCFCICSVLCVLPRRGEEKQLLSSNGLDDSQRGQERCLIRRRCDHDLDFGLTPVSRPIIAYPFPSAIRRNSFCWHEILDSLLVGLHMQPDSSFYQLGLYHPSYVSAMRNQSSQCLSISVHDVVSYVHITSCRLP